jgi:hypothetical protein
MSRTKSIAGVRPLGWLARVRAQSSCLAWACPAQLLGGAQRGWRQSRRRAWKRAMTMRVSAGARPRVVQTEKRTCTCQKLETGRGSESAAAHVSLTIGNKRYSGERAKTSPFRQSN